ncbi:uncharacterized protein RCC_01231 [Ramularia collo-cygni]|uniref:C2H2-type domain-containing protein n=1 Tax=Ramularia collo-cygni TaxID=112498 RepID=A0A2D3UNZ0_9PEZI|nr:uncharacterized protein RCC_01231 [Ramularia collo-cygni]CZT15368.1 uncharacterized protein RCC_01231 [Ramularia collo-cygni]
MSVLDMSPEMFDGLYEDSFAFLLDPALCPSPSKRQRTTSSNSSRSSMSSYFYSPPSSEFNFSPSFPPQNSFSEEEYPFFAPTPLESLLPEQTFGDSGDFFSPAPTGPYYQQELDSQWMQPMISTEMAQSYPASINDHFMDYPPSYDGRLDLITSAPSSMPARCLSAEETLTLRATRAQSLLSNASSAPSRDYSRGVSPSASEMSKWGHRNSEGTWSCAYPGCSSRSTFSRGCDLRKHFKRHTKSLFCRHEGCPQSVDGGFSSKKDRSRHEAKHNPGVVCEWDGCERLFSRQDNMKDHVRRVHKRRAS